MPNILFILPATSKMTDLRGSEKLRTKHHNNNTTHHQISHKKQQHHSSSDLPQKTTSLINKYINTPALNQMHLSRAYKKV